MEMQTETLTFQDLWRAAKKRLWVILAVSIAVAMCAVLLFTFLINPKTSVYRLKFTLTFVGLGSLQYPDGSPFYYQDLVSEEMLARAKASDATFSNIDTDGMAEHDKIVITADTSQTGGTLSYTGSFTLAAQKSYFKNARQATKFLKTLAQIPVQIAQERVAGMSYVIEYDAFERVYFEDRLELLSAQKASILAQYDEWIRLYRNSYVVAGKTLMNYRAEAESIYSATLKGELSSELVRYGFVPAEQLEARRAELAAEKSANEEKIAQLRGALSSTVVSSGSDYEAVTAMLAELLVRNVDIDEKLAALNEENVRDFESRVESEYRKLSEAATTLQGVATSLFEQESRSIFATAVATSQGGTAIVIVGIGGLVLSVAICFLVIAAVEYDRRSKAKKGEEDETKA